MFHYLWYSCFSSYDIHTSVICNIHVSVTCDIHVLVTFDIPVSVTSDIQVSATNDNSCSSYSWYSCFSDIWYLRFSSVSYSCFSYISLVHLMRAIAHAHASTRATSLMRIKDNTHHFLLWRLLSGTLKWRKSKKLNSWSFSFHFC